MPDSERAALEILHRYKRGEIRMEAALVALRAALPRLASPAGDVAGLVDEFAIAAGDLAIATGTDAWDVRQERYVEVKAALVASIATISAERERVLAWLNGMAAITASQDAAAALAMAARSIEAGEHCDEAPVAKVYDGWEKTHG